MPDSRDLINFSKALVFHVVKPLSDIQGLPFTQLFLELLFRKGNLDSLKHKNEKFEKGTLTAKF
jgi:hypothetical protein